MDSKVSAPAHGTGEAAEVMWVRGAPELFAWARNRRVTKILNIGFSICTVILFSCIWALNGEFPVGSMFSVAVSVIYVVWVTRSRESKNHTNLLLSGAVDQIAREVKVSGLTATKALQSAILQQGTASVPLGNGTHSVSVRTEDQTVALLKFI